MYIVKAEAEQIEKIVKMCIRAFETDVNVGGIKGGCPSGFDSIEWHKQMAREGHLYQAMIENDLVGAAIVFPDETEKSVYIGWIFIDSVYHRKGYGLRLMDCIEKHFPCAAEFHLDKLMPLVRRPHVGPCRGHCAGMGTWSVRADKPATGQTWGSRWGWNKRHPIKAPHGAER